MASLVSLATAKARLSITDTSSDDVLRQILDAAERASVTYLGYDPSAATQTEFYDGNGTEFVVLRRKPVTAVTSVYEDWGGYYGEPTDSFDATDTVLTEGEDWVLKVDGGSQAGVLVRIGRYWPVARRRPLDRLGTEATPCLGSIKVTYTAGLTAPQLADIAEAIYSMAAALWVSRATGMGPFQSESLDGYSRSLGGLSSSIQNPALLSPIAELLLQPHRRARYA